MKIKETFT